MREHLTEIFRRIRDEKSPNNSYSYEEIEEAEGCLSLSVTLRKPTVGSGLLFKKTYKVDSSLSYGDCRVAFMSDLISNLLNLYND